GALWRHPRCQTKGQFRQLSRHFISSPAEIGKLEPDLAEEGAVPSSRLTTGRGRLACSKRLTILRSASAARGPRAGACSRWEETPWTAHGPPTNSRRSVPALRSCAVSEQRRRLLSATYHGTCRSVRPDMDTGRSQRSTPRQDGS